MPDPNPTIVFVLKGYPRLSETFIAQEIRALEKRGLDILIVSLRQPTDNRRHPLHSEIRAPVLYLPEFPLREIKRLFRAWVSGRKSPGYTLAFRSWFHDFRRQPTVARLRAFSQALVLAHEMPACVAHLHAHFLHTPASVTRYTSMLSALPWSCSAHAVDIWTTPEWDKREKIEEMRWLTSCTQAGWNHLVTLASGSNRVELDYHGLDLQRFPPPSPRRTLGHDGSCPHQPVRILSVGRAVEKKGFDVLIQALGLLPPSLHWRFTHIGAGPLLDALKHRAEILGLGGRITWAGPQLQEQVLSSYRSADLFVLPCRIAKNGDRDGLPNVLLEAQSQGLACISTPVSGIPELIEHGVNGLLTPPDDARSLAEAIIRIAGDLDLRYRLGGEGVRRVGKYFNHEKGIENLFLRFKEMLRAPSCRPSN